jgi:hypothetical protein
MAVLTGECSEGAGSWEVRDTGEDYSTVPLSSNSERQGNINSLPAFPIFKSLLSIVICVSCVFRL